MITDNMTEEEINKQIAELEAQRAKIEKKKREQAEVEKKKREEECEKDFETIQTMINEFNKKYSKELCLTTTYRLGDDWSKFTLIPSFLRGLI